MNFHPASTMSTSVTGTDSANLTDRAWLPTFDEYINWEEAASISRADVRAPDTLVECIRSWGPCSIQNTTSFEGLNMWIGAQFDYWPTPSIHGNELFYREREVTPSFQNGAPLVPPADVGSFPNQLEIQEDRSHLIGLEVCCQEQQERSQMPSDHMRILPTTLLGEDGQSLPSVCDNPNTQTKNKSGRITLSPEKKQILERQFSIDPYPDRKVTQKLADAIKLPTKKIKTWFVNARSRRKHPEDQTCQKGLATALHKIDQSALNNSRLSLERWLETPLADEGISEAIIEATKHALGGINYDIPPVQQEIWKATRSVASTMQSASSRSSCGSWASFRSVDSRGSRRGRKTWMRSKRFSEAKDLEPWPETELHCTWPGCDKKFRYKSEWSRHEEAMHYHPYHWVCCADTDSNGAILGTCFVCNEANISASHYVDFHFDQCKNRDINSRSFFRADHLAQHISTSHLKNHRCIVPASLLAAWKQPNQTMEPGAKFCGFCHRFLSTWPERRDHVYEHIKSDDNNGLEFKTSWKTLEQLQTLANLKEPLDSPYDVPKFGNET